MEAHEQRTVYVLSSIAIVWLQRHHRRCHRAAELRYRATTHVFGRTLACHHPRHHPTPYVAGAISPPRSRGPPPLGSRAGHQLDFSVPRLPDDRRRRILAAVLLRPHHRYGALPTHLWRKTDRRQKSPGLSPSPAAPSSSRHKVWAAICPLRVSLAASSRPSATH